MKLIYNSQEVANNTLNYPDLNNKPTINNVELVGDITLRELNIFPINSVLASVSRVAPREGTGEYIGSITIGDTEVYYYKRVA